MASFMGEIEAFKPGNVSIYADGHDMTVQDFIQSAEVSVPHLCDSDNAFGERVFRSVLATQKKVGCNTNLGMLLLFTPIICAAEMGFDNDSQLRQNIETTLSSLKQNDADQIFKAISLANPGGLGEVEEQDVNKNPDCSLLEAMYLASERDTIALQYINNFSEVFELGYAGIKSFVKRWNSVKWATVSCYLCFMSMLIDSHILRKYDTQVAERIRKKGEVIANKFNSSADPETEIELLKKFDKELKKNNYNPGTSADLTAASLLVYNLTRN